MFELERDHDNGEGSQFILPRPLVPESENNRSYIFLISDDEEEEDMIEKMYGPFENVIETSTPYPKPFARIARNADRIREEQILELREAIKNREQMLAQNLIDKKNKEIEAEWKSKRISFPENKDRLATLRAKKLLNEKFTLANNNNNVASTEPIVIDSDPDDFVEIDQTNVDAKADSNNELHVFASSDEMNDELHDDSDDDSFGTAEEADATDTEAMVLQYDAVDLEKEVKDLDNELQKYNLRKKDIKVKLLGIKVKLSIEKNRKELMKKPAVKDAPLPKIGSKRPSTSEPHFKNKNAWRPTTPQPEYNHNSTVVTIHEIHGQPMAFSQQIPPHIQHFSHQQQPLHREQSMPQVLYNNNNNRYNSNMHSYMNPLPPPPPPPDTMPPPYIPPPPPPPTNTMPSSSPFPAPYVYKKGRYTNRHKDTWQKPNRFTAAVSPYADLNSPISRMENADELQAALVHVSDLISVRIFSDEKHDKYPISVDRKLPRSRRLVTVDKCTFAESPTNVCINYFLYLRFLFTIFILKKKT